MDKYYVYKVARGPDELGIGTTKALVYVIDAMAFALTEFDPLTMEFSGVMVEAETIDEATKIYAHPGPEDKVFWSDEPMATKAKRNMFEKEKAINCLAINKLQLAINTSLDLINKQISEMAFRMRKQTENYKEVTVEQIYARLKERATDSLNKYARYNRSGDDM